MLSVIKAPRRSCDVTMIFFRTEFPRIKKALLPPTETRLSSTCRAEQLLWAAHRKAGTDIGWIPVFSLLIRHELMEFLWTSIFCKVWHNDVQIVHFEYTFIMVFAPGTVILLYYDHCNFCSLVSLYRKYTLLLGSIAYFFFKGTITCLCVAIHRASSTGCFVLVKFLTNWRQTPSLSRSKSRAWQFHV